jgi:polar amino acid transport system substrate-binding protein
LLEVEAKLPGARLVNGNFMIVNHGLGTPRTRTAAAAYLQTFVDHLTATGFIQRAIATSGVQGLSTAR